MSQTLSLIGNENSHIMHSPDCHYCNMIKQENRRLLNDTEGYRACSKCNPALDQTMIAPFVEGELNAL